MIYASSMFACWNIYFNVTVICLFVMCVSLSLWLVRLALFTLSPPSPDSSLGMTVIMHMAQQLQVWPYTSLILLRGGIRRPFWKPTNPYSTAKALTMISRWTRGWSGDSNRANELYEQRGEVNKAACLLGGRSLEGGDAFSHVAQQLNHGLNFWNSPTRFKKKWGSARPCNDDKKSLCSLLP